jgi:hypothetical protein
MKPLSCLSDCPSLSIINQRHWQRDPGPKGNRLFLFGSLFLFNSFSMARDMFPVKTSIQALVPLLLRLLFRYFSW